MPGGRDGTGGTGHTTRTRDTPIPPLSHRKTNSAVSLAWAVLNAALNEGDFLDGQPLPLPGIPKVPTRVSPLSLKPTQRVKWLCREHVVPPWAWGCFQSLLYLAPALEGARPRLCFCRAWGRPARDAWRMMRPSPLARVETYPQQQPASRISV